MILRRVIGHFRKQECLAAFRSKRNAVMNGLLSDATRWEVFRDIDVVVAEMPGLIPAFEYLFKDYGVDENSPLETMAHLVKAVNNYKQANPAVQ